MAPTPPSPTTQTKTFTLLRHGQSTWNAAGRIQGSSDFSQLTPKGQSQARRSAEHIVSLGWSEGFDAVWSSTLTRARQTADIVLPSLSPSRSGDGDALAYKLNAALREIDLYSFQGLDKNAVPDEYRDAYAAWKADPAAFEIDGHRPVVELWDRAAAAWRDLRGDAGTNTLVVAHNAVNQALLCTAMGLPPSAFRKVLQTNAAVSRLTFDGDGGDDGDDGDGAVIVQCINRAPENVVKSAQKEQALLVVSCGELRLADAAREAAFGPRATVVEVDAAACDRIMKERLRVTRSDVSFACEEGGLTIFGDDELLTFNSLSLV